MNFVLYDLLLQTPLMVAAEKGKSKAINEFVRRITVPNSPDFKKANGDYNAKYEKLLYVADKKGDTALHKAAKVNRRV